MYLGTSRVVKEGLEPLSLAFLINTQVRVTVNTSSRLPVSPPAKQNTRTKNERFWHPVPRRQLYTYLVHEYYMHVYVVCRVGFKQGRKRTGSIRGPSLRALQQRTWIRDKRDVLYLVSAHNTIV